MLIPDTPTQDQEEILTTLRALAGLVAQALRQEMARDATDEDGGRVPEGVGVELRARRDLLLHQTRRLLPALSDDIEERDYRRFAEWLVSDVYLQDLEAIADHGCDPLTCAHDTHDVHDTHERS